MKKPDTPSKQILPCCRSIAVGLLVLMLIGFTIASGCSSTKTGKLASDFTLEDLDGNSVRLSDLRGKVVFLNFWATTCPPCKAEMPDMESLYQKYKGLDVVLLGVNLGENENVVRQFVDQNSYSWTFLLDETGEVSNKYEIDNIPTSFFLDTDGIIRAVQVGRMSLETMESNLMKAINKE